MQIGIGTYSFGGIASYLGLGPTLLEKFKTIRSLGYNCVELLPADLDNDIEDIKKWLDETGLTVTSIHAEPTEEIVKKMAALGGKAVIWAGTPFCNKAEAIEVAHVLDEMAAMAEPYGIKIGYHNHSQEFFFDEGKSLLEHLLDNSSKCFSQLDCGWAMNGGMYPPYFIRKYKLDEFPQLINVLKGNMSIVGPRPEVRKYVDLYTPEQLQVLQVRPGITDPASIRYRNENELLAQVEEPERYYREVIMPDKLRLNLEYVQTMSLGEDLRLIFSTFRAILKG